MEFTSITHSVVDYVAAHQEYAAPIVFTLAFLESLAFLSLLVPSTAMLLGISALLGAAGVNIWPIWLAGGTGAAIGYSISYWLGYHFKDQIFASRLAKNQAASIERAKAFFEKYGVLGVFLGHFVGPIRAVIPVVAGAFGVKHIPFEIANVASSFLWISIVLSPGYVAGSSDTVLRMMGLVK